MEGILAMKIPVTASARARARWLLTAVLCSSVLACTEQVATSPIDARARPLIGTTWRVLTIEGAAPALALDSAQYLRIVAQNRRTLSATARVACNSIFANVDTMSASIRFDGIGASRVWCGDARNSLEEQFVRGLAEVEYFVVLGDTLWLYDGGRRERLRFTAR